MDAIDSFGSGDEIVDVFSSHALPGLREVLFKLPVSVQQVSNLSGKLFAVGVQQMTDLFEQIPVVARHRSRLRPGERLGPSSTGGDSTLGDKIELADLSGGSHVSTTAQFQTVVTDLHDPDTLVILFAKQGLSTHLFGTLEILLEGPDRHIGADPLIHHGLDVPALLRIQSGKMREVETQALWGDEGTGLADVIPENSPECFVQ